MPIADKLAITVWSSRIWATFWCLMIINDSVDMKVGILMLFGAIAIRVDLAMAAMLHYVGVIAFILTLFP